MNRIPTAFVRSVQTAALWCALVSPAWVWAQVTVTKLVTNNQAANAAQITDVGLVNAWGLSNSATSPFWVSSNGAGTSTLYSVNPTTQVTTKSALVVTIPGDGTVTGQVFNSNAAAAFNGNAFLFVSEDGTVSGWRGALGSTAEVLVTGSTNNVYKGVAFATIAGNSYLYAANFRNGTIDVAKGSAAAPGLAGNFTDPNQPAGYAPFNIQNLDGTLYVAYAQQDSIKHDELAGAGLGFVNKFDLQGNLLGRLTTGGTLDAPWGFAIAPSSFGAMAGALLVGNFGDGRIAAYDSTSGIFLGQVLGTNGLPVVIDGLWALAVGNGGNGGSKSSVYFTAGPNAEANALLGVLTPVPEPSVGMFLAVGLVAMLSWRRRRRC